MHPCIQNTTNPQTSSDSPITVFKKVLTHTFMIDRDIHYCIVPPNLLLRSTKAMKPNYGDWMNERWRLGKQY